MEGTSTPTEDPPPAEAYGALASLPDAQVPAPPPEHGAWLLAGVAGVVGLIVLVAALTGILGGRSPAAPPPVIVRVAAPSAASGRLAGVAEASARGSSNPSRIVAQPSVSEQRLDERLLVDQTQTHISTRWMEGFYPIYAVAQATFGVNWLLLASIHRQESAFSTAPGTYHGLNFAGCCGGPMQFNVTNGPVTTWQLVADSYIYGRRPASYDHMTARHPSIYDDFDAIMAAAHLLSVDGAEYALDGSAWDAAYDYYGHDATGVSYADQVLARAIGWSQHGFCINCGVQSSLVEAVHAAYGASVLEALEATPGATRQSKTAKHAKRASHAKPAKLAKPVRPATRATPSG